MTSSIPQEYHAFPNKVPNLQIALYTLLLISTLAAPAQQLAELPDAPQPAQTTASQQQAPTISARDANQQSTPAASKQQPKRILGIMPNYRAVSAGAIPPPPTPKEAFGIATRNSFDYSSYVFVGITSLIAEGGNSHPQLGKGVAGFGRYYWRGFVDKTDGNYLVIFALPSLLHEDGRYFAKGEGSTFKRALYASSRVVITRTYSGNERFNNSEIFGRGIAQAISTTYYPSKSRTVGQISEKYAYALGRDALTNTFREFWPDIATHLLHRHP